MSSWSKKFLLIIYVNFTVEYACQLSELTEIDLAVASGVS